MINIIPIINPKKRKKMTKQEYEDYMLWMELSSQLLKKYMKEEDIEKIYSDLTINGEAWFEVGYE